MHASPPSVSQNIVAILPGSKTYHCGTLTYTKIGLFMLFAWLLWGDFCYTMMESVVPSIVPLKLKALGCSNMLMAIILSSAPGVLNMTICPYVSFKSDRYRSKWGRRIPFIIWTMPFLCACLALMGFSDDLCGLLQRHSEYLRSFAPASLTIGLIAVFMIMFQFFNMFVGSVFWYLFNDVVPAQFLARFMGAFRIVGTGASAIYQCFIFKYANIYMREIFTGAAVLYLVGFGMACLMIKEGEYPPPSGENDKSGKGLKGIITFFKESFSHRFYVLRFLCTSFGAAGGAIGTFMIFFNQGMGLSLEQIGYIGTVSLVAGMAAMYLMAIFVDRWHPLRICTYGAVFGLLGNIGAMVWIFVTLPGDYFFWLNIGNGVIGSFMGALVGVAGLPSEMRIFPQSRFGQFCSAQAMLRSTFTVVAGLAAGAFIDMIRYFYHDANIPWHFIPLQTGTGILFRMPDYSYRFIFVWIVGFGIISAAFLILVYREWYRLGGDKHFHPPAPWSPQGIEEMPVVPIVGPQTKWLNLALRLFDALMILSLLEVPAMMYWMHLKQAEFAFKWYGMAVLPLAAVVLLCWIALKRSIRRDIAAAQNGLPLRNGLPHHGMLIIFGVQLVLAVGIWVCQEASAVFLHLERGAIVFGIAHTVANFVLIGMLYLMCRVERGYSVTVDEKYEVMDNA